MTIGAKRSRTEKDDPSNDLSSLQNYKFNFVPKIKPNQKIFFSGDQSSSIDQPPAALSVNTLTHRFSARLRQFEKKKKTENKEKCRNTNIAINSVSVQGGQTAYEPRYLRHQDISYTVIIYIQMAFNIIISGTVLYIFAKMILAVKQDFRIKAEEYTNELHKDKLACTNNYFINHCGEMDRIPAIEDMCNEWAACMNRDVVVAHAKVSAEAIAEIINSFVEPISYKTLV
ncbi:MAG: Di-sulfide bridge nucleocytoplasmic transport domain-containing protein [Benjaminiella poitrasii]|nr:MAG: Di-sulfide bridge nucleocytoplasmic transport domain-containing protein [Benjaminiella poitrasii]